MPQHKTQDREFAIPAPGPFHLRVLGLVLAGGKGTRLFPLTRERAKPAVPFGGKYRIIDFVLSNFINSGINSIYVLTQFRSQSLLQHLSEGWQFGGLLKSHFIIPVPAQMRSHNESWYQGTADAIFQNINLIEQSDPHVVAIFGARPHLPHEHRQHDRFPPGKAGGGDRRRNSCSPRAGSRIRRHRGQRETDASWLFTKRRPMRPPFPAIPAASTPPWATTFSPRARFSDLLTDDAKEPGSHHDFGMDILPKLAGKAPIYAYNFETNRIPGEPEDSVPYWRDVGTIEAYYEANMDLSHVKPELNLYNREWPVRSTSYPDPPAKFAFDEENRRGEAHRQHRLRRMHSFRRPGAQVGSRTRRPRAHRRAGGRLRHHGQLRHRPPRQSAPRHPG